ncbi:ATP-binding protein [Arthrobacter sp. NEB 688]|uniref:ATP-binding protein n=1 Tax=Arthrobacter sp. NEB 688 TaxID=904039 RepID=UPI0015667609|nr:ATP-binding protein [Arthrobacter sp. NEB 688]QKE82648.1 GAF domain-containing protein [Arthrobacter sp. NEB 688]
MQGIISPEAGTETDVGSVPRPRVVRADEVAGLRRSSPHTPIVALVDACAPDQAVAAQLAGATVVVPCGDPAHPDLGVLGAACEAARAIVERTEVARTTVQSAAHSVATNASAVAMAAQLLEVGEPARRKGQLRRLADEGARLAWHAARGTRSARPPLEVVDVADVVATALQDTTGIAVRLTSDPAAHPGSLLVLGDRIGLLNALDRVLENSRYAGAEEVEVRVAGSPDGTRVVLEVRDDGCGLPAGWTTETACAPFASGWDDPRDGLGLCEVNELVQDHGGRLVLVDRPGGRGVVCRLELPRSGHDGPVPAVGGRVDAELTLAAILEKIARREPLTAVLEDLGLVVEQRMPGVRSSILLLDRDAGTLRHGAGGRLPDPYRRRIDGVRIGPYVGSCGTAAFTRTEVVAHDIATDVRWVDYRAAALEHGLRACWSTPIVDDERDVVLGTFAVYHDHPWSPDASATALIQRLTHAAAIAIRTSELHAQLVESEALFRSTFETTGLGIALVDPAGVVRRANAALQWMTGHDPVGQAFVDLVASEDVAAVGTWLARSVERGVAVGPGTPEVRIVGSRHEPLPAAMSGTIICAEDGSPRFVCVELFDLTERRRVAQARRNQVAAEAASRAKSELVALVSHELRTPLNAVMGFAQVLQTVELPPARQRQSLAHILGAGQHLLATINDLLDLTGAETGQLHLVPEPVNAMTACRDALSILAALADERSIEVVGPRGRADAWMAADPHRLRQVLLNVVGNAIKFTPRGGTVTIEVDEGRITVQDNGPGIAAEHLPHLFTPFHRAGAAAGEGSGLGLALSRQLVLAMGGSLAVVTQEGEGSTFAISLPPVRADGADRPDPEDPVRRPPAHDAPPIGRVLHLEDDPASRALMASALEVWPGVEVTFASSCAAARHLLATGPAPDVVVLDVELPDGTGWDVLAGVVESLGAAAPAAVVLTGGPLDVPDGASPAAVLGKPVVVDALRAILRRHLRTTPTSVGRSAAEVGSSAG